MFFEKILEGLSWGLFLVSALVPVAAFSVAWSWLKPKLSKPQEEAFLESLFEEEPELPETEPSPTYRFTASTIVKPPDIVRREDIENED